MAKQFWAVLVAFLIGAAASASAAPTLINPNFHKGTVNCANCSSFCCWTGLLSNCSATHSFCGGGSVCGGGCKPLVLTATSTTGCACEALGVRQTLTGFSLCESYRVTFTSGVDCVTSGPCSDAEENACIFFTNGGDPVHGGLARVSSCGNAAECLPERGNFTTTHGTMCDFCFTFTAHCSTQTINLAESLETNGAATARLDPTITITPANSAPELDPASSAAAIALVLGIGAVIAERRSRGSVRT